MKCPRCSYKHMIGMARDDGDHAIIVMWACPECKNGVIEKLTRAASVTKLSEPFVPKAL